jgi:predicted permease
MSEVTIDFPVLVFALGTSVATGLLFGLVPVAQRRAHDLATALKEGGDRGIIGPGRHRIRRVLVMAEVALAVMLVVSAGLLIRTLHNLTAVDAGFDRSRMVTFAMTLPMATSEPDTRAQAYQQVLEKLRTVPGVQAASAMSGLPFGHENFSRGTRIENYKSSTGESWEIVLNQLVMTDYFKAMGIPIVAGRPFDSSDIASHRKVVVINETLAKTVWKDRDPIGQRLRPNQYGLNGSPWHTIVGVAKDVKQEGVDQAPRAELYIFAEEQMAAPPTMNIVLRTTLPPAALAQTVERLVREVDPAVPVVRLRDMDTVFAESIRRPRLVTFLLGLFAGLALLLAAIGTYGVLSYMVTERRREIGIRIALGAKRSSVFGLVMKQGLYLTIVGVIAGVAGAFVMNGLIASLLFGVQPTDRTTLAAVVATITLVAALACWLPAWRASRVDPSVMLKHE